MGGSLGELNISSAVNASLRKEAFGEGMSLIASKWRELKKSCSLVIISYCLFT